MGKPDQQHLMPLKKMKSWIGAKNQSFVAETMCQLFFEIYIRDVQLARSVTLQVCYPPGTDPGFQVRGAHLKKLRRVKGGAKMFGIFRVKNHDFKPKIIFFPIAQGNFWGISFEKSRFYTKKSYFFQFQGGAPPWIRPCPLQFIVRLYVL